MNPKPPYILSGPATRRLASPRTSKLILLAIAIAILTFLVLALRAQAAPPYPVDRKTQDYYQCRYVRHEATSRLCIQFRPHRGTHSFKPKN